ncbi:MAG: hypothetical protein RL113_302, partial [Pseudomonadota bacterium]
MDETPNLTPNVNTSKGFALLITLSVLSIVIALTAVLLSYFDEASQEANETKALIQADLYYKDITKILQSIKDKKTLFSVLYTTDLPLQASEGNVGLVLHCEPLAKGVNINWLSFEGNPEKKVWYETAQGLFDFIAQNYPVKDPGRFREMLLEEIGKEEALIHKERERLYQKSGIASQEQFFGILGRYQFEVDDPEVKQIPWEKYFSFVPSLEKIDAQYSAPELLAYLFDIELVTAQEFDPSVGNLETFI